MLLGAASATILVCVPGIGVPTVAAAAPSESFVLFKRSPAEFSVRASKGYSVRVDGAGGRVTLSAEGPAGTASYTVPGRVTRHGIHANFGKRGRIETKFRPSSRMTIETPPNRCEGRPRVTRWGAFVGTIRFRGERGFTRLRVRRATGRTRSEPRWKCKPRRRGAGASRSAADDQLPVVWEVADRRRGLEAQGITDSEGDLGLTAFFASVQERRKRMRIMRFVIEFAKEKDFTYDESLTTAIIAPPAPFAGRGRFERRPGADSWTGSLSVVLPGTPRISLVGPRYHPRVYRLSEDGIAKPAL